MSKTKVRLLSIEMTNFESHAHTILEGFSEGFNCIAGDSDVGKCLSGDTLLLRPDGSRTTIYDILKSANWTLPSIEKQKMVWKNCIGISSNGHKPVFELETVRGRKIKATGNHRFFTDSGWKELKDFRIGDWIAVARRLPVFGDVKLPNGHARLIGYLLGDGSTIKNVAFTNEEIEVLEHWKSLILNLGDHHFIKRKAGNAFTYTASKPVSCEKRMIGSNPAVFFSKEYNLWGHKNRNKQIPEIVFRACQEDVKEVLLGLFITDGCISKVRDCNSYVVEFSTTSKIMAEQISHLLLRFGIVSKLRKRKTSWNHGKNKGEAYSVDIHGKEFICLFAEVFGTNFTGKKSQKLKEAVEAYRQNEDIICRYDRIPRTKELVAIISDDILASRLTHKEIRNRMGIHPRTEIEGNAHNDSFGVPYLKKLAEVLNSDRLKNIAKTDLYYDKVHSITYVGEEPTFDVEVEETHSLIANDIFTHNSSIFRAVKLCGYNEFDQDMVRIGADFCEVKIVTTLGWVYVKKGPAVNEWTIKRNDCLQAVELEKVGKAAVQQACDVLGIRMITLGDLKIPVNVMDQLEPHFFISGVGKEKTTGSMRAEIIDEICGLNGAEELINAIALDQYRISREISVSEQRIEEVSAKLFSEADIARDEIKLARLERLEQEIEDCQSNKVVLQEDFIKPHESLRTEIDRLEAQKSTFPDVTSASRLIAEVQEALKEYVRISGLYQAFLSVQSSIQACMKARDAIPKHDIDFSGLRKEITGVETAKDLQEDYKQAVTRLDVCNQLMKRIPEGLDRLDFGVKSDILKLEQMQALRTEHQKSIEDIEFYKQKIARAKTVNADWFGEVSTALKSVNAMTAIAEETTKVGAAIGQVKRKIHSTTLELKETEDAIKQLLTQLDVCPVTGKPIGDKCSLFELKEQAEVGS